MIRPKTKPESADTRVAAARDQLAALQGELADLEAKQRAAAKKAQSELVGLADVQSRAVRNGDQRALAAAETAERRLFELNMQEKRFSTAVEACQSDIERARAALAEAERALALQQLEALRAEARALMKDMPDFFTHWAKLTGLWREGLKIIQAGGLPSRKPFTEPRAVWQLLANHIDRMNSMHNIEDFTPPDLLNLFFGS